MQMLIDKQQKSKDKIIKPDFSTKTGREFLAFYLKTKFKQILQYDKKNDHADVNMHQLSYTAFAFSFLFHIRSFRLSCYSIKSGRGAVLCPCPYGLSKKCGLLL